MTVFHFGDIEVDASQRVMMHRGVAVETTPRAVELLVFLIRHRDRIVERRELHRALWPDVHVTEGALNQLVWDIRRVLTIGGAGRAIQTMRGRGYQFVAQIHGLSVATGDERAATPATNACIGRERELGQLRGMLTAVHAGRGGMVLLHGEAGIGKTCLAEAILAEASEAGILTVRVSCRGRSEALPSVLRERIAGSQLDPRAVVVLIDDVHAATARLILQLRALAPRLVDSPTFVLVAYRQPLLTPWQARLLSRLRPAVCIRLRAIQRRHVELLVQQAHGPSISSTFVDDVYDLAGGNPALVREVARSLSDLSS